MLEMSQNADECFSMGKALYEQGDISKAIVYFEQAIELDPTLFWGYHLLGCALEKADRLNDAVATWRQAVAVEGTQSGRCWSYHRLALAMKTQGKYEEAIYYCKKAVEIEPTQPEFKKLLSTLNESLSQITSQADSQILYLPASSKYTSDAVVIEKSSKNLSSSEGLPVPPPHLMEYGESQEHHLRSGKETVLTMFDIVQKANFDVAKCGRILEFGCANGRLLRWFADLAEQREIWGVDIQSDKIFWSIENLNPPFNFAVNTTVPHLPFRDGYFDFIFAGSIFSHLNELHMAWLLELARILSPKGLMYLTFHDEHTLEYLTKNPKNRIAEQLRNHQLNEQIFSNEFDFVSVLPYSKGMLSQVFVSAQYIQKVTRNFLHLVSITPNAYSNLQTGYLFTLSK
jgi:tetratricopeptide (TPR) repeat protein